MGGGLGHLHALIVVVERADRLARDPGPAREQTHGETDAVEVNAGFLLRDALVAHAPADLLNGEPAAAGIFRRGQTERRAGARRNGMHLLVEVAVLIAEKTVLELSVGAFQSQMEERSGIRCTSESPVASCQLPAASSH